METFTKKPIEQRILDKPINLTLKGDNVSLAFLSSFSESVEEANGVATINLAVRGTIEQPHYDGTLKISNLSAKLSGFDQSITNGRLELRATEGIILLEHLSCQMGPTSFLANGNIEMDGIIPTVLNIKDFKVQDAQINDFARTFLDDKFAEHLFGHVTAEANMKVDLSVSHRFTLYKGEMAKGQNVSSNLKFKDVLIEWKDNSVVQYRVRNSQDIEITLKDQRLYFDFVLEDAMTEGESAIRPTMITVKGDFKLNEKLLLDMDVLNFDVSPMKNWINSPYELAGVLNYRLRVRGTPSSPVIYFDWSGEGLTVTSANIDKFVGEFTYNEPASRFTSDQILYISGQTKIGKNSAQFSASIPIDISLQRRGANSVTPAFHAKLLNKRFEGQLDMKINDLEFVPLVDSQLAYADGNGEINITMAGQFTNPAISGLARFDNISFYLPGSNIEVKDTELSATIDESGIKFDRLSGILNNGDCDIVGKIGLPFSSGSKKLELSMDWKDCEFKSNLYWDLIKCSGSVRLLGDTDRPVLVGNAIIDEVKYKQSFEELVRYWRSKNAEIQSKAWYDYPILRNMELNIELQAPNNLWLTTGPLTVEANIYGRLLGEVSKAIFEGRMDILQGELWYLDHKFIINEGYLSNQDPYRFNPKYFISAEIDKPLENIEIVDAEGESHIRDIKIYANFSGYLEEHNPPDFSAEVLYKEFGEHYELDRQQIISILTVGSANVVDTDGMFFMTDTASAMLRKQAQLYVSSRLAKLIGFRSFRFDFTPNSLQQSRFLVTKDLTKRWAITYSSTLQIYEEPYIELEYRLNKHMAIKGERNEEGKYGVDLKFGYGFK